VSRFTEDFNNRCLKYSFVKKWTQQLEAGAKGHNKYLLFVYSKSGHRNGGFGDRMGGIVTAFSNSIRYNRSLVFESFNGFDRMFKPYHPTDSLNEHFNWTKIYKNYRIFFKNHFKKSSSKGLRAETSDPTFSLDLGQCIS
jgi:hypothetical protein